MIRIVGTMVLVLAFIMLGFMAGWQTRSRFEDHRLGALLSVHWSGDVDDMVKKVREAMSRLRGVECKEP